MYIDFRKIEFLIYLMAKSLYTVRGKVKIM